MKIRKINENFYSVVHNGFSRTVLEIACKKSIKMPEDSFAAIYIKKIIYELFMYACDLRYEYLEYYSEEYNDFSEYLYQKELWEEKDINGLKLREDETILRLRTTLRSYNADNLLNYEGNLELINAALEDIHL